MSDPRLLGDDYRVGRRASVANEEFQRRILDVWLPGIRAKRSWGEVTCEIHPEAIDASDAASVLTGFSEGLITGEDGYLIWPNRNANPGAVFWEGPKDEHPRPIYIWREPIVEMATLVDLHLRYGWPLDRVWHQSKAWEFDVVTLVEPSDQERVAIAAEAKSDEAQLRRLLREISACIREHDAPDQACDRDRHKKYLGLLRYRPSFFWALAPGDRRAFAVAWIDGRPGLQRIPDVPTFREWNGWTNQRVMGAPPAASGNEGG